jgi:hypothetical protein
MASAPTHTRLRDVGIGAAEQGLEELSGLALAHDRRSLWVVGDETARLFRVDLDGQLDPDATVDLLDEDIEGITLDPGGGFLYAVREKGNEILQVDLGGGAGGGHPAAASWCSRRPATDRQGRRTGGGPGGRPALGGRREGVPAGHLRAGLTWRGKRGDGRGQVQVASKLFSQ